MLAEDRPIHFSTELMHPPSQLKIPVLQKLYYDLSQTRITSYDSADFSMPTPPRFHSKRGPKAQSIALFLPDRIVLVEEWVDMPLSQFLEKAREVAGRVLEAFEIEAFVAQTAVVRTTFALSHHTDARTFLLDHACGMEGRIAPYFGRPLGTGGLRFVLPATPDHPGDLHVVVESFRYSPDQVFAEVKGVYPNQRITSASLDTLARNISHVRGFITHNVYQFLEQFDRPYGDT